MRRLAKVMLVVGAPAALLVAAAAASAIGIGAFTTRGAWSFVSAPQLHPPKLPSVGRTVSKSLARGLFLFNNQPRGAPGSMVGEGGPLITDQHLQPVWFAPVGTRVISSDLHQETYLGKPVLVWWQGVVSHSGATTSGQVVVMDETYRRVATLKAQRPWVVSLHDAVISGNNIWITVYRSVPKQNLRPFRGSANGTVYDAGVQEYDLRTGKLLYTWDALNPGGVPNVPLSASYQPANIETAPGSAWDAYHLNSIQVLPHNQILVSMRNTWAVYLIDTQTGKTIWTLGGKHSSFSFANGARFAWQHDVDLAPNNQVTLFNDNCCQELPSRKLARANGQSEGMVLKLDPQHHRASVLAVYRHNPALNVAFLGSMQRLPGGNVLVGWGSLSYFSEYTRSGRQILDVLFPNRKGQTYRAFFSSNWVGTPFYPPTGAARRTRGKTTVYASWNGATQVTRWQVLAGATPSTLKPVASTAKSGFETPIALPTGSYKLFELRAFAGRKAIGTSKTFQ
jgi:Arylsulfotransferase (ASST)